MNQTMYLVDSNALVALARHRILSAYFRAHCRVTADVLWEAREHPEQSALAEDVCELTPAVLEQVRAVMKTVDVGDTGLVDLYKNKGTADPGLIASALDAIAADEGKLLGDTWILVTNDRAVEAKAVEFGIAVVRPEILMEHIDTAAAQHGATG
ncbi:hypothetical protein [Pengzhenrongella sicca]|uniref:PIN domain-containing protein n=1 Tax=Pengzhenrongella sicca TaxID=2819238 RepID=A0A8A4ZK47_9MICO|nr:hypothetical protein [Pengzhenrongella sicca]QTE30886.1 hypothetical protein J4E96_08160 [Pengzhenrongella sicca]